MSLELKGIEKKVGEETHIYNTDLKFEKNTINVLLGSTLAGKTTLMQIMAGLDKPTSGEIWFNQMMYFHLQYILLLRLKQLKNYYLH